MYDIHDACPSTCRLSFHYGGSEIRCPNVSAVAPYVLRVQRDGGHSLETANASGSFLGINRSILAFSNQFSHP